MFYHSGVQLVKKITIAALLMLAMLGSLSSLRVTAQASNPPTMDEVNAVARQLYCPVCENIPLDVCPTQACAQWRDTIREKLVAGWSEEQIKQYFVDQYGDRVLAEPPKTGLNWLVYILPPIIFLAGVFFVYRNLTHLKKSSPIPEKLTPESDDPYYSQMEAALKSLSEAEKD
jgi:cytochrome c-type biogenesis protein CcmH